MNDIKSFVERQFATARRAKTDEDCMLCVKALREERENLLEQDRLLKSRVAKLYAKVEFIRENNKIVGYVISAVKIVIAGMEVATGAVMVGTMNPLGVLGGAILITDGINGVTKEYDHFRNAQSTSEGVVANEAMDIAQYMGFKPESGLAFYDGVTLAASVYSIVGLARKPAAWRLFRWVPRDYVRQIDTMSRPKLTMKITSYGIKAKVIFDLINDSSSNN